MNDSISIFGRYDCAARVEGDGPMGIYKGVVDIHEDYSFSGVVDDIGFVEGHLSSPEMRSLEVVLEQFKDHDTGDILDMWFNNLSLVKNRSSKNLSTSYSGDYETLVFFTQNGEINGKEESTPTNRRGLIIKFSLKRKK